MTEPRVLWTFHGTSLVRDYRAALDWLGRFLGCTALEYSDAGPPVSRRGGCCWIGDTMLELMEPNDPASPGGRYLDRFGPGLFNLALQVDDVGRMALRLAQEGAPVSFPPDHGFTFTHPRDSCGVQFEWADLESDWDPRFGAVRPPAGGLVPAPRVAWWGALVRDPAAAVARFTQLWQPPVLFCDPDAPPDRMAAALSLGDGILALYRLPDTPAQERALWGVATGRPRTHLMAMRVADLTAARATLAREGIGLLRREEGAFVTLPDHCEGLTLLWTDRDVPGDPRGPL